MVIRWTTEPDSKLNYFFRYLKMVNHPNLQIYNKTIDCSFQKKAFITMAKYCKSNIDKSQEPKFIANTLSAQFVRLGIWTALVQ